MSTFSQKHYRKIAECIKDLDFLDKEERRQTAIHFANRLSKDNNKFKKHNFYFACGFTKSDIDNHVKP